MENTTIVNDENVRVDEEFYDFNEDRDMWAMPCCGSDYDCACD